MKTLLLAFLLFGAFLTAHAQSVADLDAKNGFRDVSFGEPITKIVGLSPTPTDGSDKCYKRRTDVLKIENVPLKGIDYCFYRGVLASVSVYYNIATARDKLLQSLQIAYGLGLDSASTPSSSGTVWLGKQVAMILTTDKPNTGTLFIKSLLVEELRKQDQEKAYKKRAGGL